MFRVPVRDLGLASGLDRLRNKRHFAEALDILREEVANIDGRSLPVFDHLEICGDVGRQTADWIFSEGFSELFVEPSSFARIDIRDTRILRGGLDHMLYRQVRLVWNRRHREARIGIGDIRRICGFGDEGETRRVMERLRRALARVSVVVKARLEADHLRHVAGSPDDDVVRISILPD